MNSPECDLTGVWTATDAISFEGGFFGGGMVAVVEVIRVGVKRGVVQARIRESGQDDRPVRSNAAKVDSRKW